MLPKYNFDTYNSYDYLMFCVSMWALDTETQEQDTCKDSTNTRKLFTPFDGVPWVLVIERFHCISK